MVPRPALVDIAIAHRPIGVDHADRAEVDVDQCQRNRNVRGHHVHDVRGLHRVARLIEVREYEHQSADEEDGREDDQDDPEHDLLAGVEPARRMLVALEISLEVQEPLDVVGADAIVADETEGQERDGDDQDRTDEVVQVLGQYREP